MYRKAAFQDVGTCHLPPEIYIQYLLRETSRIMLYTFGYFSYKNTCNLPLNFVEELQAVTTGPAEGNKDPEQSEGN